MDERMPGAWHAPLGQWTMTFEADADGHYRTSFHGPFAPPAETGGIEALDGTWQVRKDSGETDGGTDYFVSDDAQVMQRSKGALTWQIFSTDRADQSYLIPTQPQSAEDRARRRSLPADHRLRGGERTGGGGLRKVPPHYQEPYTWNCIYQVGEDQRRRLSLKVDEAYLFDSPAGFATLDACLGDTLLEFGLGGPAGGREQTLTRLAHHAVQRLVAGDGITAEASPDAKLIRGMDRQHRRQDPSDGRPVGQGPDDQRVRFAEWRADHERKPMGVP